MLLLATLKSIEVIGEASTKVTETTRSRLSTVDWTRIRQMRNRTIHGYDTIDLDIVWKTVQEGIPPLIAALEKALQEWP
jgi:uncharacterized protein with HEPN domain